MKKLKKWCLAPLLILCTCFNPLDSNSEQDATLSITLPSWSAGTDKAAWDTGILTYEVTGDGPSGKSFSKTAPAGDTVTVRIVPGTWQVQIKATAAGITPPGEYEVDSEIQNISVKAGVTNKPEITMRFRRTDYIHDYLSNVDTAPIVPPQPVSLHLAMALGNQAWFDLLSAISSVGKSVALNLSACTEDPGAAYGLMAGGVFDPYSTLVPGKEDIESLILPEAADSILGYTPATFNNFTGLKHVDTGNGITDIGNYAFFGLGLTSVTLGNNVAIIGDHAFEINSYLESVIIPDSVTDIGEYAFAGCSLETLTIGNHVTTIGDSAFAGNQLTSVIIPDSVTTIGDNAFESNILSTITIGDNVETIGVSAFSDNELAGELIIPDSVNDIGNSAFFDNEITKVTIPDNITIGWTAFFNNVNLTTVIFKGDNVTLEINTFENSLYGVFNGPGGGAGTYELDGSSTWVKQ